ncbi:hypothetical protein CK203_054770 [Vitis vinifera]|uniref:Uncharacterized protein n=1 Tax=Vitis vinifera TaxID=29760 RepID=A0A438GIT0_VITVI|nr:hypothetical protein CK203_054770 [Vitis vinifera]
MQHLQCSNGFLLAFEEMSGGFLTTSEGMQDASPRSNLKFNPMNLCLQIENDRANWLILSKCSLKNIFSQVMSGMLVIFMVLNDLMWTALGALHLGNPNQRYDQSTIGYKIVAWGCKL